MHKHYGYKCTCSGTVCTNYGNILCGFNACDSRFVCKGGGGRQLKAFNMIWGGGAMLDPPLG